MWKVRLFIYSQVFTKTACDESICNLRENCPRHKSRSKPGLETCHGRLMQLCVWVCMCVYMCVCVCICVCVCMCQRRGKLNKKQGEDLTMAAKPSSITGGLFLQETVSGWSCAHLHTGLVTFTDLSH